MRIIIDFPAGITAQHLPELAQLAQLRPQHALLLTMCFEHASQIEASRQAVASLGLPLQVYHLPASANQPRAWLTRARAPVRQHFFASLQADVIYLPDLASSLACGLDPAHTGLLHLLPANSPDFKPTQWSVAPLILPDGQTASAYLQDRKNLQLRPAAPPAVTRPRLAYISPLPPEKSGIADYSADLIPYLNQHYQVEVVLQQNQLHAPWIEQNIPLRSLAWFQNHAHEFDRVLYHIGNSPMHQHMFDLMEQHPGVLVLHDFYLGNVLDHLDHQGILPGAFEQALYYAHGWSAMMERQRIGQHDTVWHYPCNKALLDQADGVIVHSRFPCTLAEQWYGDANSSVSHNWRIIPLLRTLPQGLPHDASARAQARQQLGLAETDFVICSFGMLGRTKFNERLLDAWLASNLAGQSHCKLVFVGENDAGQYGQALAQRIRNHANIHITGFVSSQDYQHWLLAADGAVQLRTQSRGETSAAVLDCLLYGLPTIVNAHGANVELPDQVLIKLADDCPAVTLALALQQLYEQPALRQNLGQLARDFMQAEHAPEAVAANYFAAIEHFVHSGPNPAYRQLLHAMENLSSHPAANQDDYLACASAIAHNRPALAPRQCLIDISAMVQLDLKTGIQRVVRSILMALLQQPPAGYRVEAVYTRGGGGAYHYARRYLTEQLGMGPTSLQDTPVETRAGDMFLGLDLFMQGTSQNLPRFQAMRDQGMDLFFVVYDILPLLRPDVFPHGAESDFGNWLNTIAQVGSGLVCISRAVAAELQSWLEQHPPVPVTTPKRPLSIGYFHLGADIDASAPSRGLPANAPQVLQQLRARPSILMVGTLEPRKGHAQSLAAFDLLWAQGVDVNLVIVGKHGWMVDNLAKQLQQHPEQGQRLFWLAGTSDEMLLSVYQASSALLAASEGEGFGLPLIEAAQHQMPIIARALPVFKEVAGEHAFYFDGMHASDLAKALTTWLKLFQDGQAPHSKNMPWLTWQQSAEQLKAAIRGDTAFTLSQYPTVAGLEGMAEEVATRQA
ncbi:MAG: hypothetical protein RL748_4255 [Pseudomonadota bacterium]|jgi:glycosyltransferase involved in cell wall biosynthesis